MNLSSINIQTKIFEKLEPAYFKFLTRIMFLLGKLAKRLNLIPFFEDRYLSYIAKHYYTRQWEAILKEHQPSILVSTMLTHTQLYRFTADLPPIMAAIKLKIPVGTLVQSWDNPTTKASVIPHFLDKYWIWSQYMGRQLAEMHPRIPANRIITVGSPQFDFHIDHKQILPREEYLKTQGLDPAKPYIVIGTATIRAIWWEHLKVFEVVKALKKIAPEIQCLVRIHPKDMGWRWEENKDIIKELGIIIQKTNIGGHMDKGGICPPADFYKDQINIIHHSIAVVNTASTIAVDAAIIGKPIIAMEWDEKVDESFPDITSSVYLHSSHYGPLTATGGITTAKSPEECAKAVLQYKENPKLHSAEREKIINIVCGNLDGRAGINLAREVLALRGNKP